MDKEQTTIQDLMYKIKLLESKVEELTSITLLDPLQRYSMRHVSRSTTINLKDLIKDYILPKLNIKLTYAAGTPEQVLVTDVKPIRKKRVKK